MKGSLKNMNNKKGFTLVELSAVIVVLAIIILVAMPNVMSAMEKARKNAFYSEATEICKIAQSAYSGEAMAGTSGYGGGQTKCIKLTELNTMGYMDKNLKDYKGAVQISFTGDKATTKIWISNKSFRYNGADCKELNKELGTNSNLQTYDDTNGDVLETCQ